MNKKSSETSSDWQNVMIFFIVLITSLPILNFLYDWYYNFQISKLSNASTLLFIHDDISQWIITFSIPITIFLIIFSIKNYSHMNAIEVKICLIIIITIIMILTFFLFLKFFDYTDINKDGIHVRNNIFSNIKDYKWSDVTSAKVSYKRGNKGALIISYDIYFDDGKIVHANDSKDFFNNIANLDNLMQNEKIVIDRQKILSKDYNDFVSQYQGPGGVKTDRLEVVLKILSK